jgi:hypothetical protein
MKIPCIVVIAFAATCIAPVVSAQDGESVVSVSGFGTLGAVYHDLDGVEFRRDISQPDGAKAHQLSLDTDSMLGLQMTARPSAQFEATVQLVSRNAIDVGHRPQVTWAYVKYKPTEDIALRAGRLGVETYMQGDSAAIGYANLLVRQPVIFYPSTYDGMDLELLRPLGAGMVRLKGTAGLLVGKLLSVNTYDSKGSPLWSALAEYAQGAWTGRVSAGKYTLKEEASAPQLDMLKSALSMTPNGAEINAVMSMKNRAINYTSLALAYDSGPLQGRVGLSTIASPGWATLHALHSHIGYRIGKVTPYAAYSRQRANRDTIPTGIPSGLSPATDALNQAAALAQGALKVNQSDFTLGVRYDISRNTSIKFQVDRILYQEPRSITDPSLFLSDYQSRDTRGLTMISLALDFAF